MQVNGVNGIGASAPGVSSPSVDAVSKGIQNQIASAQQQLQKLSADRDMSVDEKQKKRQEIQKEISELNTELRQHQAELRREQQAQSRQAGEGNPLADERAGVKDEEKEELQGVLSDNSMKAIISAESALAQAEVHGKVVSSLEGRARVLQSEIRQSESQGSNTEDKKNELEKLEKRITRASGAQTGILSGAVKDMSQAAKDEISPKDEQKKSKEEDEKVLAAEKLNLAAGTRAYQKGKFYSNVDIHI